MLLRMPGVGGGTTKRDRLSLLVGAVYRMVQGCFTPRDPMLSVVEMSVEFVVSTGSNFQVVATTNVFTKKAEVRRKSL